MRRSARRRRGPARDARTPWVLLLAAVMSGVAGAPPPVAAQDVPGWVQEAEQRWWDAFNAGDARGLTRLFSEDAVVMHPHHTIRDPDLAWQFFTAVFRAARYDCQWTVDRAVMLDDLAAVYTSSRCAKVPLEGDRHAIPLDVLKVYARQDDGSWLIVRAIAHPPLEQ